MKRLLAFIHGLQRQAVSQTEYGNGFRDALAQVEEYADELLWEVGDSLDDDDEDV